MLKAAVSRARDGKRSEQAMADLAARKARREAGQRECDAHTSLKEGADPTGRQ